jgi:hypothetical protein
MKETWKTVIGFESYEVSDLGNVRRQSSSRLLKPTPDKDGYLTVKVGSRAEQHTLKTHRLVAQVFVPNPKNLPQVNHTGGSTDNRACKLEWISTADHGKDVAKRGQRGEGVCFEKRSGKWRATYNPEPQRQVHIGYFSTRKEAKKARDTKIATL